MTDMIHNLDSALRLIRQSVTRVSTIRPYVPDPSDAHSVLAADFKALLETLAAFDKHLQNHRTDLPVPIYRRTVDAVLSALIDVAGLECDHCAGSNSHRLGVVARKHKVLCEQCDELFATCDGCKDDDLLITEAVTVESKEAMHLYHKDCAPRLS